MVPPAGLEPATNRLETCCSIQLSYGGSQDSVLQILQESSPHETEPERCSGREEDDESWPC